MNTETLICKDSNGQHDRIVVSAGTYAKHEHRWDETIVLRCRVCNGKRVPEERVEVEA